MNQKGQPPRLCEAEKACLFLRRGAQAAACKAAQLPPILKALPPPPLLQVHKFINRNRDHLDSAMVEMLGQSQLKVTWRSFQGLT